jgi:hypothetical protein
MDIAEPLISLSYTEGHPDRCRTFLGIFSTMERAREAMGRHMSNEKQRLPYARISRWNYTFDEARLDADDLLL